METDLFFYLTGAVDTIPATYAAYKAIETHMLEGKYIGFVPTVLCLEYLSPLHGVTPTIDGTSDNAGADDFESVALRSPATDQGLQVSPWAIGACVATLMGGVISVMAYNRKVFREGRRRANDQLEDLERNARNPTAM
jgi:hypothetical protein